MVDPYGTSSGRDSGMSVDTVWSLALFGFGFGTGVIVGFLAAMKYKA